MIKIPGETKKHSVPNNSDLFGTIYYTKNINLDEEGYIKLSQRTAQIQSEKVDANHELPIAFGRVSSGSEIDFHVVTSEDPFEVAISPTKLTVTENTVTDNPNYVLGSHGRWFHNLWVSTDTNGFYSLTADGATWDAGDTSTFTNSGVAHPVEVFRNKDRICFGDGNLVKLFSESSGTYTLTKTLTLPSEFEVIGLAYSNYKMGILTKLSSTASGQNQDAYFFAWDGSETEAGQGIETGSDRGLGITAYKGSFVILTRTGQLRYFTGGGWQELAQLPYYFLDKVFGNSYSQDIYGDSLSVEGDVIYINFTGLMSSFGSKYQKYLPNNPGGILVYDPKIGLYQKYSHSISPLSMLTVTQGNVNTTTDVMTVTAGTIPSTGSEIKYTSSKANMIGGLKTNHIYYCIRYNSTTFSLASTKENAHIGTKIDLTGTGTTNNYFLGLETYDFGATLANLSGGIANVGTDNEVCNHLIFGSQLNDFNSTSQYYTTDLVVSGFSNRGYIVTPKILSSQITDDQQKLYIKHRILKSDDKIIVKMKNRDYDGLPVATPQGFTSSVNQCAWTNSKVFTTTADLSDAKTVFDTDEELECEVIAGAGAGCMVKITNITYSAGTYTVTLEEDIVGAYTQRYCDVIIDNWKYLGEVNADTQNNGVFELPVGKVSSFVQYKIELRGVDTTIIEKQIINKTFKPSV